MARTLEDESLEAFVHLNTLVRDVKKIIAELEVILKKVKFNRNFSIIGGIAFTAISMYFDGMTAATIVKSFFTLDPKVLLSTLKHRVDRLPTSSFDTLEKLVLQTLEKVFQKIIVIEQRFYVLAKTVSNILESRSVESQIAEIISQEKCLHRCKLKADYNQDIEVKFHDLKHGDYIYQQFSVSSGNFVLVPTYHHGVVLATSMNVLQVVHFTRNSNGIFCIEMVSLNEFVDNSKIIYKRDYKGLSIPVIETERKAYAILQQDFELPTYNLLDNNCEHFATYLKRNEMPKSQQVQKACHFALIVLSNATNVLCDYYINQAKIKDIEVLIGFMRSKRTKFVEVTRILTEVFLKAKHWKKAIE